MAMPKPIGRNMGFNKRPDTNGKWKKTVPSKDMGEE